MKNVIILLIVGLSFVNAMRLGGGFVDRRHAAARQGDTAREIAEQRKLIADLRAQGLSQEQIRAVCTPCTPQISRAASSGSSPTDDMNQVIQDLLKEVEAERLSLEEFQQIMGYDAPSKIAGPTRGSALANPEGIAFAREYSQAAGSSDLSQAVGPNSVYVQVNTGHDEHLNDQVANPAYEISINKSYAHLLYLIDVVNRDKSRDHLPNVLVEANNYNKAVHEELAVLASELIDNIQHSPSDTYSFLSALTELAVLREAAHKFAYKNAYDIYMDEKSHPAPWAYRLDDLVNNIELGIKSIESINTPELQAILGSPESAAKSIEIIQSARNLLYKIDEFQTSYQDLQASGLDGILAEAKKHYR